MTTFATFALACALAASVLVGFALFVDRRRRACGADGAAAAAVANSAYVVPFTQLGVDVEAPCAPDWSARAPRADRDRAPLALAHVDRATAVLHDHLRREPAPIAPWLMLLELYRTHGREQALADLARDFAGRFHSPAHAVLGAVRGGSDAGLEAFPPLMRLVTMLWGTHECRDLLARLSRDRSEGRRFGLSRAAYVDIATLGKLLDALLAELDADRAEEIKLRAAWRTAAYVAQN